MALSAQPIDVRFEHLTQEQGLSNNLVIAIVQDHQGFMWFGTHDGLNKYDGYQITPYRHDPSDSTSLSSNWIESLLVDQAGVLWEGTYGGGLNRFDASTNTFIRYPYDPENPSGISDSEVAALYEDSEGMLWVGTLGGLNRFDRDTETFTLYSHVSSDPSTMSNDQVRVIYEDRQGTLWIGTGDPWDYEPTTGGLNRFDRATGTFTRFLHDPDDASSLIDNRVKALYEDTKGTFWVGTWGDGLHSMNREHGTFTRHRYNPFGPSQPSRPHLPTNPSFSGTTFVHEDREGVLWIGAYNGGLGRYDPASETLSHYMHDSSDPTSLSSNNVYSVYESSEGVLWVGTYAGVNKVSLSYGNFRHYVHDPNDPASLSDNLILSLYEDRSGDLWVGTEGGGLNMMDRATGNFTQYVHDPNNPASISHNEIITIYEDREGVLWVGTGGGGLNKLDRATGRFTRFQNDPEDPSSLGDDAVFSIWEDRDGMFWIGTAGGGVEKLDRATGRFTRFRGSSRGSTLRTEAIYEDRSGRRWVGVFRDGLYIIDPATETLQPFHADPAISPYIKSIVEDQTGHLWIGTDGAGLYWLDPDSASLVHYTMEDGLPSNVIAGVIPDIEGHHWISTNHGLSEFNPQTGVFRNYDLTDGLQGNIFHFDAFFSNDRGELFFGGSNGFNTFFPADIRKNNHVPPLVLTSIKQWNEAGTLEQSRLTPNPLELSYHDKVVAVEFAALDFTTPEKNQYAYKLEGVNDWIKLGTRREVVLSNLAAGDHVLRIRGSNNHRVWNTEGLAVNIYVSPPWWKTWWFRSGISLMMGLLLYAAYSIRTRRIRTHNRMLQAEIAERKRAEAEREHLIEKLETQNAELERFTYTVSHDLKSPLVTIMGFLGLLEKDTATGNTERIRADISQIKASVNKMGRLLNELLELSRIGRLINPPEEVPLTDLVYEAANLVAGQLTERGVAVEIATNMPVVSGDRLRLLEVYQNLLDNAIKFMGNQATPRIEAGAIQHNEGLACFVKDNGIGIKPEYHESVFGLFDRLDSRIDGTGIGLALVKRIVEVHGGRIWIESDGLGKGSTFWFTLPSDGIGASNGVSEVRQM